MTFRHLNLLVSLVLAGVFAASTSAHATPIFNGTYTAAAGDIQLVTAQGGTTPSTDTLTGSLTFSSGTLTGGSFTFTDNENASAVYSFTSFSTYTCCSPVLEVVSSSDSSPGAGGQLILDLELTLNSSGDIVLCGTGAACNNQSYGHVYSPNGAAYISSGTLDSPAAATPEPSSLLLLGTGALGCAGLVRRKLRRV